MTQETIAAIDQMTDISVQPASPCEALHQERTARIDRAIASSIDLFIGLIPRYNYGLYGSHITAFGSLFFQMTLSHGSHISGLPSNTFKTP
jgi:hypothetical protein